MIQNACSICGRICNNERSQSGPEGGDCVCEECGTLYDGYCEACYDMTADSFE